MTTSAEPTGHMDDLLDRAVTALNRGDVETAHLLAGEVLRTDADNQDADALLSQRAAPSGEIRRLTIMFADVVGSTEMSGRLDPETYRRVIARYQAASREVIERHGGHLTTGKGDGLLALFGYPTAHENDAHRAVQAGLDLLDRTAAMAGDIERDIGELLQIRVAVHKGLVFLDLDEVDVYGLGANVAARLEGLADPGTLLISDAVERVVRARFETEPQPPRKVKGVDEPVITFRVVCERSARDQRAHRALTPLVGRDDELAVLRAAWQTARRGERPAGNGVILVGEPGIGKSRLAQALAEEVAAEGAVVLELVGSPHHDDAGLFPVRSLVEGRCGFTRSDDASERLRCVRLELAACGLDPDADISLLAPILDIPPEAGYERAELDARRLGEAIADAARRYLLACIGSAPGLVVADDVQWFDESTLELVNGLMRTGPPTLLTVMTSRTGAPAGRAREIQLLELEPLAGPERLELIRSLRPADLSLDAQQVIAARSDGIPLYLEELTRGADDELVLGAGPAVVSGTNDDVPDVLYEPLFARLYATPGGASVAAAAATIGREVDRSLLEEIVELSHRELEEGLRALVEGRILERLSPEPGAVERYRFRHDLLRAVAYDIQPPSRRKAMHARVAEVLVGELVDGDVVDWRIVAAHHEQADRPRDAASAYERAADSARSRGALTEARANLSRAIELTLRLTASPTRDRDEVRLRLRRGLLAVSVEGNASPVASADYERCMELALHEGDSDELRGTLVSLWGYYLNRADLARSEQVLDVMRSLDAAAGEPEPTNTAGRGLLDWMAGRFDVALTRIEAAAGRMVVAHDDERVATWWSAPSDPRASVHAFLILARFMGGDPTGSAAQLAAARRVAAGLRFPQGPFSLGLSLSYGIWVAVEQADFERADATCKELAELAERHAFDSWAFIGATQRASLEGTRALDAGALGPHDLVVHAQTVASFVGAWYALGQLVFLTPLITLTGALYAAAGQHDEAAARYDESLALAEQTGMHFYDAETRRCAAHLEDDREQRSKALIVAHEQALSQGAVPFALRIARDLHELDGAPARPRLKAAIDAFAPGASSPDLAAAKADLRARR
jgi:class 3 adenylate cyclase